MSKKITSIFLAIVMLFGGIIPRSITAFAADTAENYPLNSIVIKIEDAVTHSMLVGARFEIYYNNQAVSGGYGTLVATVDSDASGVIVISGLPSGYYIVRQTVPPNNYHLSINNEQHCYIKPDGTSIEELVFSNYRYGGLVVILNDKDTGKPIPNATFSVSDVNNKVVGTSADGIYMTDSRGEFYLENLPAGDYKITQLTAAQGYAMDSNPNSRTLRLQHTNADQSIFRATFENSPLGSLLVRLKDSVSKEPLAGAVFNVKISNGADLGEFTTSAQGSFLLPKIDRGTYIISQASAPVGYLLATSTKTKYVDYVDTFAVDFENSPQSGLHIVKIDADTKEPLKDAKFRVYKDSTIIGTYTTNADGAISIPNLETGWYTVSEHQAPQGYVLDDTPQSVQVTSEKLHKLTFEDKKLASLQIVKTDEYSGNPLSGASFRITKQSGEFVADVTTDASGKASVPGVSPDWYVISETKAPCGYIISEVAKTVEVKATVPTVVTITNKPLSGIEIIKTDAYSHAPLSGATFVVERDNGERIGSYKTDNAGKIIVSGLTAGTYIVSETIAPEGYILDNVPQTVIVKNNKLTVAEFTNKPYSGIQILKTSTDGTTPLMGAVFTIERVNGERIGKYTTDVAGKIVVHGLSEGVYIVSEVQAPDGYLLSSVPQTVEVKSNKITIVEFTNKELPNIYIRKVNAATGALVAGAEFIVEKNGVFVASVISSSTTAVVVPHVQPGIYTITEVKAPAGYELNDPIRVVEVTATGDVYYNDKALSGNTVTFGNNKLNSLEIVKLDSVTHNPLSGAMFDVTKADGTKIGSYRTDASGKILIPELFEGTYVISETAAPQGYILNESPKSVNLKDGKLVSVEFLNKPLSGIEIVKLDAISHKPLQGASFTLTKADGERIGTFKTEADGKVLISDLDEGVYVVGEVIAPDGYQIDESPKNVTVKSGKLSTVEFTNKPYSGIEIIKTDSVSHKPLSGATFEIVRSNGEKIGTYKTDVSGKIIVSDLEEGVYIISETIAPDNYVLDNTPQTVTVKSGKITTAEFVNKPFSGIEITKIDSVTGDELAGAVFEVRKQNGEFMTEVTTDKGGRASIPCVEPGWYVISEIKAPTGYAIEDGTRTIEVKTNTLSFVTIPNKPLSGIQILKTDEVTNAPLMGATFTVNHANGEFIGKYDTDIAGKILVSDLVDGTYVISEISAPDGYILDSEPQTVIVKSGKLTIAEFTNRPLSGLRIVKLDSSTREPIEGVEFAVNSMDGEMLENDFRSYTFKTDKTGQIYIPDLADGYYIVTETRAADGYIIDPEPKTVYVESGKTTLLEVLNTPQSGLLIVKTDAATGKPLEGVVFDVMRADGQRVGGYILDENQPNTFANSPNKTTSANGDITGSYTTDKSGRIRINALPAGEYHIVERKALAGYELDETVHAVTVTPGKLETLQVTNTKKAGLRILKIDSITKNPIYGVEFMVFDEFGYQVGTFFTDNNGLIDFNGILSEGRYTLRETRPADGYYRDDMPRTVEFKSGKVTEVVWENTPEAGQIQITKLSGNDNEQNGLEKGTPLEGAIFEIYEHKSGNLVDRFVSGNDGRAVSKPLPLGRYTIKEVQAPQWYMLSSESMDIEIEFATQIIKREFVNYSANTGVKIRKTGNYEAMSCDTIRYDIKEVGNTSSVPLTNFFWRDVVPTNAVRLTKIQTGTYNQSLKYKVMITTNKGDSRVIADNLSTKKNNVIDCRGAALGLSSDEYVTSFTFLFGTVKAGFCEVTDPQVYMTVKSGLANGFEFANKVDVGGKYGSEWVVGGSSWVTKIYAIGGKLPKTGY